MITLCRSTLGQLRSSTIEELAASLLCGPQVPGIEFTLPDCRLHFVLPDHPLHATLPACRLHFVIPDEDNPCR